jgi:hypothetical protein
MKIFKKASLILGVLLFFGVSVRTAYTLGRNTEFNKRLWILLNVEDNPLGVDFENLPKDLTKKDVIENSYNNMKKNFALNTQGEK